MQSEKQIEAAARADAAHAGRTFDALSSSDKTRFMERAKIMLEAALPAAEPIRWMWEERRSAESDIWDDMYDDEPPAPHKHVRNIRPLYAALSAQVQDVATAREFADRMFKLHGFMLSEEYRGNPAVTITFPNSEERNQFYSAIVELSTHKTPAAPAKQDGGTNE